MIPTEKQLTVDDIRRYLKVCEWGDVPDMAQSIFDSMKLDGFLPLTAALASSGVEVVARVWSVSEPTDGQVCCITVTDGKRLKVGDMLYTISSEKG